MARWNGLCKFGREQDLAPDTPGTVTSSGTVVGVTGAGERREERERERERDRERERERER